MDNMNEVMTDLLIEQEDRLKDLNHGHLPGNKFAQFALKAERIITEAPHNENKN